MTIWPVSLPGMPAVARLFLLSVGLAWFTGPGCAEPKGNDASAVQAPSPLNGSWVTRDLYAPGMAFDTLFPAPPVVTIDVEKGLISGMSGCNQYMGKMIVNGQALSLPSGLAVTERKCPRGMAGEAVFLGLLRKVNHWTMYNEGRLHLLIDDMTVVWLDRVR